MKTARKVGIVIWALVAVLLVGLMITGIAVGPQFLTNRLVFYSGSGLNDENTEIAGEYSVDIEDIKEINLNWKSGLIRISTYNGNDIKLTERVPNNSKEYDKMTYKVKSGKLSVDSNAGVEWYFLSFGPVQKILHIEIPEDKPELLESIIIDSESADVAVEGLNIENLQAELTSGDVKIDSSKIDNCNVKSTSGEITMDQLEAYSKKGNNTIQAECTSGDVKLYKCTAKTANLSSTSGDSTCDNLTATNSVVVSSTSGDVKISDCETSDLKLSSSSGEVLAEFTTADSITASSTSGNVSLNADAKKINCSSSSGDVTADGKIYGADMNSTSGNIVVTSSVVLTEVDFSTSSGDMRLYIPSDDKNGFTATYDTSAGDFYSDLEINSNRDDSEFTYGNGKYTYTFESSSGDLTIDSN